MIKTLELRENQNIFDALIELGGTLEGSLFAFVKAGDKNSDWIPENGDLITLDFPTDQAPDEQIINLLKRRGVIPANKEFAAGSLSQSNDFDEDFVYDPGIPGAGTVIPGVGYWQIGITFKVSSSQQLPGVGSWTIGDTFVVSEELENELILTS